MSIGLLVGFSSGYATSLRRNGIRCYYACYRLAKLLDYFVGSCRSVDYLVIPKTFSSDGGPHALSMFIIKLLLLSLILLA